MTELWDFTIDLYAHPPVQMHALALQDVDGMDVNLMFFAAWCGMEHGVALSAADFAHIEARMAPWRQRVIEPLRALRRDLKTPEITNFEQDQMAVRDCVKELELRAERDQLQALSTLVGLPGTARAEPGAVLALRNLQVLLSSCAPGCGERGEAALGVFASYLKPRKHDLNAGIDVTTES